MSRRATMQTSVDPKLASLGKENGISFTLTLALPKGEEPIELPLPPREGWDEGMKTPPSE